MKRFVLLTGLVLSFCLPAQAGCPVCTNDKKDIVPDKPIGTGPYLSVFGGGDFWQTGDRDNPGHADARDIVSSVGWFAGLRAGYAFNPPGPIKPALELEAAYHRLNFHSYTRSHTSRYDFKSDTEADNQTLTTIINGVLRYDLGRFRPYVGVGIGAAHVWLTDTVETNRYVNGANARVTHHFGDRDQFSFAAQGLVGAEYLVSDRVSLFAEYRPLFVRNEQQVKYYLNHEIGAGVRVYFR